MKDQVFDDWSLVEDFHLSLLQTASIFLVIYHVSKTSTFHDCAWCKVVFLKMTDEMMRVNLVQDNGM